MLTPMLAILSETQWVHTGLILLIVSMFCYVIRVLTAQKWVSWTGWGMMLLSFLCLGVSLAARSVNATYFALSNMYESLLVLILWMQAAFLVLDRKYKLVGFGWPVCLLLFVALSFDLTLPTQINPLQAALQSYWRSIHVPIIILSYALFTLSFISSVVYLVQEARASQSVTAGGAPLSSGEGLSTGDSSSGNPYDELAYRCISFGFPLLAIGIILGAMWANEAWGNYWSWDPKESMSLVTLLGYGVYLHLRVNAEHPPKTLAWVSVASFGLLLLTYFGVNLMGVGLHSYGKIG